MRDLRNIREPVIAIAGAGAAGIGAAISAAASGARVVLIEPHSAPGGMSHAANVHTICGLYRLHRKDKPEFANPGVPVEMANRLLDAGAALEPVSMGGLWVLPIRPAGFASVAKEWLGAHPNLDSLWQTRVIGARRTGGRIEALHLRGIDGGEIELPVSAVVDATGDAHVAAIAGAAILSPPSEKLQRPAYVVGLEGIDLAWMAPDGKLRLAALLVEGVREGSLPPSALGAAFRPGAEPGLVWCTIDLSGDEDPGPWDPLRPGALERLAASARALVVMMLDFLSKHLDAEITVRHWPIQPGVRESRSLHGRMVLTGRDVVDGKDFPDAMAEVAWPLELRETTRGPVLKYPPEGKTATIPGGVLRARDVGNLFAAGRCLSCDHDAQAAVRVIGMGLATGQAAGRAAIRLVEHPDE